MNNDISQDQFSEEKNKLRRERTYGILNKRRILDIVYIQLNEIIILNVIKCYILHIV
jgi:hypothetical protein